MMWMSRHQRVFWLSCAVAVAVATASAQALTILDTADDAEYLSAAEAYPSVGYFPGAGSGTLIRSTWVLTAAVPITKKIYFKKKNETNRKNQK